MTTDASSYVLSFDFQELTRQIAELESSYSSLTTQFERNVSSSETKLQSIESRVVTISNTIDASMMKLSNFYSSFHAKLGETDTLFKKIEESSRQLQQNLIGIGGFDPTKAPTGGGATAPGGFNFSLSGGGSNAEDLEKSLALSEAVSKAAKKAIKDSKDADSSWKKTSKAIGEYITKEVKGAQGKLKGIMSGFSGGALAGGGMMAMIGMMVMGVQEGQRKGAERGEMANAFEGFGNLFEKSTQRAVGAWARFQEKAQYHWGVGRKEIQAVVAGIKNSGFGDVVDKNIGRPMDMIRNNAVAASINLDKFLNVATGTTAKQAVKISEELGSSFEDSAKKMKDLNLEAKASGMSFEKFTGTVLAGSSAMSQYRVDVTEVATVMRSVKGYYEDLGLSGPQAGNLAAGVTEGFASMDIDKVKKMEYAMKYYSEKKGLNLTGYAAEQKMSEEFLNQDGESSEILLYILKSIRQEAIDKSGGNMSSARYYLENSSALKGIFSAPGSASFLLKTSPEDWDTEAPEGKKLLKELETSMQTEGSKLTEAQKNQRELIDALAKVGQGMLEVTASLLGVIIVGIRSLPGSLAAAFTIANPLSSDDNKVKAGANLNLIKKAVDAQLAGMGSGADKVVEGSKDLMSALGGTLDMLDPVGQVKTAATIDLGDNSYRSIIESKMLEHDKAINYLSSEWEKWKTSVTADFIRLDATILGRSQAVAEKKIAAMEARDRADKAGDDYKLIQKANHLKMLDEMEKGNNGPNGPSGNKAPPVGLPLRATTLAASADATAKAVVGGSGKR